MFMPEDESGVSFIDTIINLIAIILFPVSLSLLFPVFLYTVVLEKEEKLIQMMKMNGMKISSMELRKGTSATVRKKSEVVNVPRKIPRIMRLFLPSSPVMPV